MLGSNLWSKRPKLWFVAVLTIFLVVLFTHVAGKKTSSSLASSSVHNHAATRNSEQNANQSGRKLSWISHVLSEKLSNFRPRSRTNHLCNQQSDLYEESLRNFTLWAVQSEYSDVLKKIGSCDLKTTCESYRVIQSSTAPEKNLIQQ